MELSEEIVKELLHKGEIKVEVSYRLVNEVDDEMAIKGDNDKTLLHSFTEENETELNEIVGLDGLADYLNCSRSKAQSIVSRGKIPYRVTGKPYVFQKNDVNSAMLKYKYKL